MTSSVTMGVTSKGSSSSSGNDNKENTEVVPSPVPRTHLEPIEVGARMTVSFGVFARILTKFEISTSGGAPRRLTK